MVFFSFFKKGPEGDSRLQSLDFRVAVHQRECKKRYIPIKNAMQKKQKT